MLRQRAAFPPATAERIGGAASAVWHLTHGAHLAACVAVLGARGRQAVVERDAGAVLAAITVCGLEPHWLAPELTTGGRAIHGVTPAALDAALGGAPGARAAIVALRAPDVAALVEAAHAHGAALVVDASGSGDAAAAIAAGADLVIDAGRAREARTAAGSLLLGREPEPWLARDVIERAVALTAGPGGAPPQRAAAPPVEEVRQPPRFVPTLPPVAPGPTVCSPRAAWLAPQERVAPAVAVGRIAAEALTPAVPGVPGVLPGERLVPDVVATLRAVFDRGGAVHGAHDGLATIRVVVERGR